MRRVRTIVPLVAFFTAVAVLTFGRPTTPPRTFGPAPAAAATIIWSVVACDGTIKNAAGMVVPFAKSGQAKTTISLFGGTFVGTETDVEGGAPVSFSFSGSFSLGAGPGFTTTISSIQKACTSCSTGPCLGLPLCKVLPAGHPELATQAFQADVATNGNAVMVSDQTVSKNMTARCDSYPSTGK